MTNMQKLEKIINEHTLLEPIIKKEFELEQGVYNTINKINRKFLVLGFDNRTFYNPLTGQKEFKLEQEVYNTINKINGKLLVKGFDNRTFYNPLTGQKE